MTDQEALRRWLRTAWEQGQKMERLAEKVGRGMPLEEACREMERPPAMVLPVLGASDFVVLSSIPDYLHPS